MKDLLWVVSLYLTAEKTPMSAGWNSYLETLLQTMQKISYLAQITESPTSQSVVQECLFRALRIMEESSKSIISVTFDLANAKIASQIQFTESPKFLSTLEPSIYKWLISMP